MEAVCYSVTTRCRNHNLINNRRENLKISNIKMANISFQNVTVFKYLATSLEKYKLYSQGNKEHIKFRDVC